MALQILPHLPSTGQKAGESFAAGIGNVLNMLTQNKLSQLQQRNQTARLGEAFKSLNLPPQLAELPENIQQQFIKNQFSQQQQSNLADAIGSLLGGGEQQPTQDMQQQQQFMPQQQQARGPMTQQDALMQSLQGGLSPQRAMAPQAQRGPTPEQLKKLNPQQLMQVANLGLKQQRIQEQRQQFMTKQELEKEKLRMRKQEHWDKETLPAHKEIEDLAKAANDSDMRLSRMEELNEGGGLNSTATETLLRGVEGILPFGMHLDLTALRTADSQEFNKLSTDFLKDAKKFFGSRVTDNEIKLFLKTVPTLTNSPEGRRRVIQNLRLFNEAARTRAEVADNIIEENGGSRPYNFKSLIEKRSKKTLDDIHTRFKQGIRQKQHPDEEVPRGSIASNIGGGIDNPMEIVSWFKGLFG